MPEPILIEKAELERLIEWIGDLQRAIKELAENAGNPDAIEGKCVRILFFLHRMREFLTVLRY
jgi:hypothetical protein